MSKADRIFLGTIGAATAVASAALLASTVWDPQHLIITFIMALLGLVGMGVAVALIITACSRSGKSEKVSKREQRRIEDRNWRDRQVFRAGVHAGIQRYDMKLRDDNDNIIMYRILLSTEKGEPNMYIRVGEIDLLDARGDASDEALNIAERITDDQGDLSLQVFRDWDDRP